jgi:hypothetical protein
MKAVIKAVNLWVYRYREKTGAMSIRFNVIRTQIKAALERRWISSKISLALLQ